MGLTAFYVVPSSHVGLLQKTAVLHPNVNEDIDADLDIMRLAVRVLNRLPFRVIEQLKWLNFEGAVEEFAYMLKPQLDLRNEAANLVKFNQNFAKNKNVVFPKVSGSG